MTGGNILFPLIAVQVYDACLSDWMYISRILSPGLSGYTELLSMLETVHFFPWVGVPPDRHIQTNAVN